MLHKLQHLHVKLWFELKLLIQLLQLELHLAC